MSSQYGWIITEDHLASNGARNEVGIKGPSDITDVIINSLDVGFGIKFKMFDDDDELYYTGLFIDVKAGSVYSEYLLAPLDEFGTPNAGCTSIKYCINGKWTVV